MDTLDLTIFVRVARLQNLSAVAAELGVSTGTISKRIQSLEGELAVRLFDRTTRSINLTEEGEAMLAPVEAVLDDLDAAVAKARANLGHPRGRLRIAAPNGLGRGVLVPAICAFMATYPEIEIQIDLTDRAVTLPESGYDVVLRTGQLPDSSMIAKRLAADPQVLVAAKSYVVAHSPLTSPDDLTKHSCLLLGDEQAWSLSKGGARFDVRVSGRLRSDSCELLRHATLEGMGIAKLSRARVSEALRLGILVQVLPEYDAGSDDAIWAIHLSNRHVLPKLKVFLTYMAEWFKDERRYRKDPSDPAC